MGLLHSTMLLLSDRAATLFLALVIAALTAALLGRLLPLEWALEHLQTATATLGRKLNRSNRDAATRAWRGVITLGILLVPALLLGAWLSTLPPKLAFLVPLVLFVGALGNHRIIGIWRQARGNRLTLQLQHPHHLFADSHALLRYCMLDHATRFAVGIVGVSFWYLLGGAMGAFAYLVLALAVAHYSTDTQENRAFGGVATSIFHAVDAAPRTLAALLLVLAGLFVPGSHARQAMRHAWAPMRHWPLFVASLLDISLGGSMPSARGQYMLEWAGPGTAKPDASHLSRWLAIWAVALLMLLVVVFPALISLNLLK